MNEEFVVMYLFFTTFKYIEVIEIDEFLSVVIYPNMFLNSNAENNCYYMLCKA